MKRFFAACAAAGFSVMAALSPAAAQVGDPQRMLNSFTPAAIQAIAQEMGYGSEVRQFQDGGSGVAVVSPEGLRMLVMPTACDQSRCVGLHMLALFNTSGSTVDLAGLNEFNNRYAFIKAFEIDGNAGVSRYITADFGIPYGNVAVNLAVFNQLGQQLPSVLNRQGGGETPGATTPFPGGPSIGVSFSGPNVPKDFVPLFEGGSIDEDLVNDASDW